jgi:hypothetical protein
MTAMDQRYEYVAVELPATTKKSREQLLTEKLNAVAQHGWRLHVTHHAYDPFVKTPIEYAIFERTVAGGE